MGVRVSRCRAPGLRRLIEFTATIERQATFTQTVVPVGAGLRLAVLDRTG